MTFFYGPLKNVSIILKVLVKKKKKALQEKLMDVFNISIWNVKG